MIKRVEIKNFRNLKNASFDLINATSILKGKNGLGKSNTLNAINWLLTDTLLTDNPGKGENDIMSIIPNDWTKGEDTEVSIILDSNKKFTKYYKRSISRDGSKTSHSAEYKINDVPCKNSGEFYSELNEALNFSPSFTKLSINEPRLYTDPLFAFQKLEPRDLRALLVSMGCSVSNDELYKAGFDDMEQYEAQYSGNWDKMRLKVGKDVDILKKDEKAIQNQLELYKGLTEFNPDELAALEKQRDDLNYKKTALAKGKANEEVISLENEVKSLEAEINGDRKLYKAEIESKLAVIKEKKKAFTDSVESKKQNATAELIIKRNKLQADIDLANTSIRSYNMEIDSLKSKRESIKSKAKELGERKDNLAIELDKVFHSEFQAYIECPICGEHIPLEDQEAWLKNKDDSIKKLQSQIDNISKSIVNEHPKFIQAGKDLDKLNNEIKISTNQIEVFKKELETLNNEIANATPKIDMSPLNKLEDEELGLIHELAETPNIGKDKEEKVKELKIKISNLKSANEDLINEEINKLDEELKPIKEHIEELVALKSKHKTRTEIVNRGAAVTDKLNDQEALLVRVVSMIQTMINMINHKANALTGIDFVMLEKNLSNDVLTEVCYPRYDGIPFKDLNTSRKVQVGVQFIEACKRIALEEFGNDYNEFPILCDKLEGFDSEDKIRKLTNNQLICTKVSTEETIVVE